MSLVWREQLSVGNDVIDSDHMYLIELVNQVERSFDTRNRDFLDATLDLLFKYSQEHFAKEEKIARAAGYSAVPHMHQSHEALVKQLVQVRLEIGAMGQEWPPAVKEHFTTLLRNWLLDHVIKEDLLMKPALQKYPPGFNPG
jgi:hemerythrin